MSSRSTVRDSRAATPVVAHLEDAEQRERRAVEQRAHFRDRHARALAGLMGQRDDLRGVHALADLVDDAVRWSA